MAALFELDKSKLEQRISEAEGAIVQRIRELFQAGGDSMPTQLRERLMPLSMHSGLCAPCHLRSSRPQAAVNDRRTWLA
jgi:hypothetical protein